MTSQKPTRDPWYQSLLVHPRVRDTLTLYSSFLYYLLPDKPQVTLSGNRSVNEGSDAFLYCKAVAYPTPVKYNWFKNRKPIISDPNGDLVIDTLEDGRSKLTVKQIKSGNHSAEHYYSCSGTNRMGTRQKSFTIYVNCKMRFLIFLLLYNW